MWYGTIKTHKYINETEQKVSPETDRHIYRRLIFDKDKKVIKWRNGKYFQQMVVE